MDWHPENMVKGRWYWVTIERELEGDVVLWNYPARFRGLRRAKRMLCLALELEGTERDGTQDGTHYLPIGDVAGIKEMVR